MTPQERKLVEELFERLATLETRPREPDAEQAIMAGLRKAPNATYALVQTVLLQDEALRNADERIRELESGDAYAPQQAGRLPRLDARCGVRCRARAARCLRRRQRPPDGCAAGLPRRQRLSAEATPMRRRLQPPQASAGGSFLGTAAAAAVGVIGGSMLMNSHARHARQRASGQRLDAVAADLSGSNASPWGGSGDASSSDLAQQAGLDNMGQRPAPAIAPGFSTSRADATSLAAEEPL